LLEFFSINGERFHQQFVEASVETLSGLSAHADAEDLKWWFDELRDAGGCGQAFIVHGEEDAANSLAGLIADACDEPPVVPQWGESFEV